MNILKNFYNMLGNTKEQKFYRFWLLIITIIIGINLIVNVGYNKEKGLHWVPADVHYTRTVNKSE